MIHTFFLLNVYTGMYKNKDIQYKVIEKTSNETFQAYRLEVEFIEKKAILFVELSLGSIILLTAS